MSPSDFGIDANASTPVRNPTAPFSEEAPSGQPGQGRPDGSFDTQPRKRREIKPAQAEYAEAFVWADSAHRKISEMTQPAYLKSIGKRTLREASSEEIIELEQFRFAVLAQFAVGDEITKERIRQVVASEIKVPAPLQSLYRETISRFAARQGTSPSAEERRRIEASVYAVYSTI
jgi:hypothetical protein